MTGGRGDDYFEGGTTNHWYESPAIDYTNSNGPIIVDLQAGTASGPLGNDTFTNVATIHAANFNDILRGFDEDFDEDSEYWDEVYLFGGNGNDRITGFGGHVVPGLYGFISGGDGIDYIDWNGGEDVGGGPGPDELYVSGGTFVFGNDGDDYIYTRDASDEPDKEQGDAGPGIDTCLTDPADDVRNCE
jgi:hypothetical protein